MPTAPSKTILFVFAGRRPNLEIQLPFLQRILDENPEVEVHLWDLCRNKDDSRYLRTLHGGRVQVRTTFRIQGQSAGINNVWQHYTDPVYRGCVFGKFDDDDVFIETAAFGAFIQAAKDHPDKIISAQVVNNGAATRLFPEIWAGFKQLGIELLDVHLSAEYAELSHRWFFQNWRSVVGNAPTLTPVDTWCSINSLAMSHGMLCEIARLIGTQSPNQIADRTFPRPNAQGRMSGQQVGDEGAANMHQILIHEGFLVGHLGFGPQEFSEGLITEFRKNYQEIAREYLGNAFQVESGVSESGPGSAPTL